MTKMRRLTILFSGLAMIAAGILFFAIPLKHAIGVVLGFIGVGMTLRGIGILWYYLSMARFMVGGRYTLYWGLLYLELGILAGSLSSHPAAYAIIYVAVLNAFGGVVSVLRAVESRRSGAHWRVRTAYGLAEILMAAAVIVSGVFFRSTAAAVYVYAAGMIYSGVLRTATAFRRTGIVYIQ